MYIGKESDSASLKHFTSMKIRPEGKGRKQSSSTPPAFSIPKSKIANPNAAWKAR
jgi:hypothetical protein